MIRRFPREHAIIERTRLRYINLPNVLNDGKGDRGSWVPGFVALFLGEETELIFLLDGEPAAAARWAPGGRAVVPVASVVGRASREAERADAGYYAASSAQLLAMFSTVAAGPVLQSGGLDPTHAGRLFAAVRERAFSGTLEIREDDAVHYLLFDDGTPIGAYLADQAPGEPFSASIDRLFTKERGPGLVVTGYAPVASFPVQAPDALVQLYAQLLREAVRETREAIGPEATRRCFAAARDHARVRYPVLDHYELGPEGDIAGEPFAPADVLTDAVAAWLLDALIAAERLGTLDPADLLDRITRDSRYALKAQGFFERLPWPVGA